MQFYVLDPALTILHLRVRPSQGSMLLLMTHLHEYFLFLFPLKTEVTAILPKDQAAFPI